MVDQKDVSLKRLTEEREREKESRISRYETNIEVLMLNVSGYTRFNRKGRGQYP